jgi:hypothetical protein
MTKTELWDETPLRSSDFLRGVESIVNIELPDSAEGLDAESALEIIREMQGALRYGYLVVEMNRKTIAELFTLLEGVLKGSDGARKAAEAFVLSVRGQIVDVAVEEAPLRLTGPSA